MVWCEPDFPLKDNSRGWLFADGHDEYWKWTGPGAASSRFIIGLIAVDVG